MTHAGIEADHPMSYASIEKAAQHIREQIGLGFDSFIPGIQLFESLENFNVVSEGEIIPLTYGVECLPKSEEALTRYSLEKEKIEIILSETTYEGLERDIPRARFSLCHEIGHAVLHPSELIRISRFSQPELALFRSGQSKPQIFMDTEWQAEALAGALLMPAKGLDYLYKKHGLLTEELIQNSFKVSAAAAAARQRVFRKRRIELIKS